MENSYIIDIKKATVFLGGKKILKDFNWQVKRGDHWFVLGANGAGKTTLVKMLMGFAWPVFGAEVNVLYERYGTVNLAELRKRIAWVSPFMQRWTSRWTGLQMVISGLDGTLGLFREPTDTEIEKALAIMGRIDCRKLENQDMDSMSSGEQVKILLCRALMRDPELIILDEACVHLDMKSREFLLATIEEMARKPDCPTTVFITQRIDDILPVFDKGMILKEGIITAKGKRESILTEDNLFEAYDMHVKLQQSSTGRFWPVIE
ncbi:ATP-binding cassette domain-containing protein [Lentisphaerota bacterium ZTH]|nr:ATP-binding cassette domain-containing protein [Lentisphaerota bacterium]WET05502.1 ATP-binding cassette domain-containing protein [Lentisphaerota bacterium ZTH]